MLKANHGTVVLTVLHVLCQTQVLATCAQHAQQPHNRQPIWHNFVTALTRMCHTDHAGFPSIEEVMKAVAMVGKIVNSQSSNQRPLQPSKLGLQQLRPLACFLLSPALTTLAPSVDLATAEHDRDASDHCGKFQDTSVGVLKVQLLF